MLITDDNFETFDEYEGINQGVSPYDELAYNDIKQFFEERKEGVFYSKQIEILFENKYFHWVTNRALNKLLELKFVKSEMRDLKYSSKIKLYWEKSYRYYRRDAVKLIEIVQEFSNPIITESVGYNGEMLVLEAFATSEFTCKGKNINSFNGKSWTESNHNLDFIFTKDNLYYGIEVKNALSYISYGELKIKIKLCKYLGIVPVFIVRMMPKSWIEEVRQAGGFVLIMKYQLFPISARNLVDKIISEIKLPVDTPKYIQSGTMERFMKWHKKHVN